MERRQFTREFKLEAVRLTKQRGVSYAQASKDLGVHSPRSVGFLFSIATPTIPHPAKIVGRRISLDPAQSSGVPLELRSGFPTGS